MNTLEIWSALSTNKHTKKYFKGVFPLDKIPKFIKNRPGALVINTDKSNQPGTHWVAIYISADNYAEYFDSYGRKPIHKEFIKFFQRNKIPIILYNKTHLQGYFSTVCGQYCCMYLLHRSKNRTLKNFIKTSFKNQNLEENDDKVKKLFSNHFKLRGSKNYMKRQMNHLQNQVQTCRAMSTQ